jgi:thiol-disulfide isomerase/thioredoxin
VLDIEPEGITTGSILTPTGDYGFLEGFTSYFKSHPDLALSYLHLSTFDGAHAFLIAGSLKADGTLHGDFWSGDTFHDTWTAKRDDTAALPDAFSQTQFSEGAKLADLKFPDLEGKTRSLADPAFGGKARIIEVFGSWCPNCNDASRYLVELHRKYKDRGLSVVGLAFEYTGDFQRDAEQVKSFAKYHEIEYTLLLAGVADREKASAALPIIDKLRAYPTIILLDAEGNGRAVYTGFSGPATGEEYTKFKVKFEAMIEEILSSEP